MEFTSIIKELSLRWNLPLSLKQGAFKLTIQQHEWHIEYPESSDVLTVYSLFDFHLQNLSDYQYWLQLNADRSNLKCAWVGLYRNELCLGTSLPAGIFNTAEFENLLANLSILKKTLIGQHSMRGEELEVSRSQQFLHV